MSLSKIDKEHANNILASLNENSNNNELEILKTNYLHYGKLKQIAKQMEKLKEEALEIIKESNFQHELQNVECSCKKVSGTTYYLYKKEGKLIFSLISPNEWHTNYEFIGSYLYDYDKTFVKIDS